MVNGKASTELIPGLKPGSKGFVVQVSSKRVGVFGSPRLRSGHHTIEYGSRLAKGGVKKYVGMFVRGRRHGFGLIQKNDGETLQGYWSGGRMLGVYAKPSGSYCSVILPNDLDKARRATKTEYDAACVKFGCKELRLLLARRGDKKVSGDTETPAAEADVSIAIKSDEDSGARSLAEPEAHRVKGKLMFRWLDVRKWLSDTRGMFKNDDSSVEGLVQAELVEKGVVMSAEDEKLIKPSDDTAKVVPKREHQDRLKRTTITGELQAVREQFFVLMPSQCGNGLQPSPDLTTISSKSGQGVVLGSRGFTRGVHYWEVYADIGPDMADPKHLQTLMFSAEQPWIHIGVAERTRPIVRGGERSGANGEFRDYGFSSDMMLRSNTDQGERLFGPNMVPGDRIGVLLNMDEGKVSFLKEGFEFGEYKFQDIGLGYTKIRSGSSGGPSCRVLYPAIGMRRGADPVTIRCERWVSAAGESTEENVRKVLEAVTLLQRWQRPVGQPVRLPMPVLSEALQRYNLMAT